MADILKPNLTLEDNGTAIDILEKIVRVFSLYYNYYSRIYRNYSH